MALIVKSADTGVVTEVGKVIIISGGGLTVDQESKISYLPANTTTELALKAPLASPAFTGTPTGINKSHVGLGNVDNTADADKPVSSATQTALNLKANSTDISAINTSLAGKADLDPNTSKLDVSQLPEGYNNVVESANFASFPVTGVSNTIYVALDTNLTYRWSGTQYTEVSQSLALGETISSAYRGDRGATAYAHSQAVSGNPHSVTKSEVGLSNVDNTSDANKPVSTAQQTALDLKANLASPTFTGTVSGISKSMVGLGNVDNTSDANKPISIATQAALNLKPDTGDFAAAISITGTHTETTTAIDFSTVQGKAITLTANRSFTISGLSASNPIGILQITHAGFTPSFSGVTALDSALDKSGIYYLKFTRQADGTITQSNQSGGGASTLTDLGVTTSAASLNKLDLLLAIQLPNAPSIVTSLSGDDIEVAITPGTAVSYPVTGYRIEVQTDGGGYNTENASTTDNPYTIVAPGAGTHDVRIYAINAIGESVASNVDSETITSLVSKQVLINLGNTIIGNYNNITDFTVGNNKIANPIDSLGLTVLVNVDITDAPVNLQSATAIDNDVDNILNQAVGDYSFYNTLTFPTMAFRVTGLEASTAYTIRAVGGVNSTGVMEISDGTNTDSWIMSDGKTNTDATAYGEIVATSNISGEITLTFTTTVNNSYLGGFRITGLMS